MRIKDYINSLVDDFKAARRGERRVAPRGVRGRIYAPKDGATPVGEAFASKAVKDATLTITVTRADGTVERQTVPAQVITHG